MLSEMIRIKSSLEKSASERPSEKWLAEQRQWRNSRPEYQEFKTALLGGAKLDDLIPLGAKAGADPTEVQNLRALFAKGCNPTTIAAASDFEAALKARDDHRAHKNRLDLAIGIATSDIAREKLLDELRDVVKNEGAVNDRWARGRVAAHAVKAARDAGLIE